MITLHMGPGNAMATLIAIEEHFAAGGDPLTLVIAHSSGEAKKIYVLGLPYFDQNGRLDWNIEELNPPPRISFEIRDINRICDHLHIQVQRSPDAYVARKETKSNPRAYKTKINKPSKVITRAPPRIRTSC